MNSFKVPDNRKNRNVFIFSVLILFSGYLSLFGILVGFASHTVGRLRLEVQGRNG